MLHERDCHVTDDVLMAYLQTLELRVAVPHSEHAYAACSEAAGSSDERAPLGFVQDNSMNLLIPPIARRRSVALRPGLVAAEALPQYLVVFAVMRLVDAAVTAAMRAGVAREARAAEHAVAFPTDEILAAVRVVVSSACAWDVAGEDGRCAWQTRPAPSATMAMQRAYHSRWLLHEPDATMRQTIGSVTRRLCDAARSAREEAARFRASVPRCHATHAAPRAHGQNVLLVAKHALDPACLAFLELCVRVCAHFEEAWPLPTGVAWPLPRARDVARGAGKRARAATRAERRAPEGP
jgi:hypothetical protein